MIGHEGRCFPVNYRELALATLRSLAEALARFEIIISANRHHLGANEISIATRIENDLESLRRKLRTRFSFLNPRVAAPTAESYRDVLARTLPLYTTLRNTHAKLIHLPIPDLRRESLVFAERCWRSLEGREALSQPALSLGSELDPSEHRLGRLSVDASVVAIAKLDAANPLSWPLAAHEYGHTIIPTLDVIDKTLPRLYQSWLVELGCDRLALRLSGSGFMAAFATRAVQKQAYFIGSFEHPSPHFRLQTLLDTAPSAHRQQDLFTYATALHADRARAETEWKNETPELLQVECSVCRSKLDTLSKSSLKDFSANVQTFFSLLDDRLPIVTDHTGPQTSLTDLARRLGDGVPIGSQRLADLEGELRQIDEALRSGSRCPDTTLAELKRAACDEPVDVLDILTAGWINRLSSFSDLDSLITNSGTRAEFDATWPQYRERLAHEDELLLSSIETADFHMRLRPIRGF